MKKVDVDSRVAALNAFREQNLNKSFTTSELREQLHKLGFNSDIISEILKVFPYEQIGREKLFSVPKQPIFRGWVSNAYEKKKKKRKVLYHKKAGTEDSISEEYAISTLLSKGNYQVRRLKGFDEARFKKENPDVYKKYLIYEIL